MEITSKDIILLNEKLKLVLSEKRYLHTQGVAYLSASLAMSHGFNHRDALIAGLLHDCAKEYPEEELLDLCRNEHIELFEDEIILPQLRHAPYGAHLAKTEYGIHQSDILEAIRYHTIGRIDMSPLEQIVYIADYLEPERIQQTEPALDEIRRIAFHSLDEAMVLILQNLIRYFTQMNYKINDEMWEMYHFYKNKTDTLGGAY